MTLSRSMLTSLILSTALVMGACGDKDKTAADVTSTAKALKVETIGKSDINNFFEVENRKVPNADAEKALKKLGLSKSNARGLSWDKKSGDNGHYIFNDMVIKDDDGRVTIGEMELHGVRTEGESATFDLMTIRNLKADSDDGTVHVERISLADPSPKLAAAITEAIEKMGKVKNFDDIDLDIEMDDEDIYFGALRFNGVEFNSEEGKGSLNTLVWGENEDTGEGLFHMDALKLEGYPDDKPDQLVKFSLGSIDATGLNMDYYRAMSGENGKRKRRGKTQPFGQMMGGISPFVKTFNTASFSDLDITFDGLHIQSDGGQGKTDTKGDVITTRQVLQPLVIKFDAEPTERGLIEMKDSLNSLGYEELVITSTQTSRMDKGSDTVSATNSYVDLKDGFRLSYDYEASGINAVREGMEEAAARDENLSDREIEALTDQIAINSLNIALADNSILDRGFKLAAEKQGSSPALLKMQAKGMFMMLGLGAKTEAQGAMVTEFSKAAGQFIDDGGTLKLSINPSRPLTVKQLRKLDTGDLDMETLGFSATAE